MGRLRSFLEVLRGRNAFESGMDEEMRFHLEACAQDLEAQGLSPDLLEVTASTAVKDRLRAHVEQALALGVFGVPTFALGKELFWGHDRLPHVAASLSGQLPFDEALHARMLARPRAAERRGAR